MSLILSIRTFEDIATFPMGVGAAYFDDVAPGRSFWKINSTHYNDFAPTVLASLRSSRPPFHKINCPFRPGISHWSTVSTSAHALKTHCYENEILADGQ